MEPETERGLQANLSSCFPLGPRQITGTPLMCSEGVGQHEGGQQKACAYWHLLGSPPPFWLPQSLSDTSWNVSSILSLLWVENSCASSGRVSLVHSRSAFQSE